MALPEKAPKAGGLLIGIGPAPKAGKEADSDMMAEEDGMEAKRMAFKALRAAIKSDDDEAGYEAFKELVSHCDDESPMEEAEEAEPEED